jgi:hypothetical protein
MGISSGLSALDVRGCGQVTASSTGTLLSRFPGLKLNDTLKMDCKLITDAMVIQHAECPPDLKAMNLVGCVNVTDVGVRRMAQCSQLQSVDLTGCGKATDVGVRSLVQRSHLQLNETLKVDRRLVTDAVVIQYAECRPDLKSVDLAGCVNMTDVGVKSLAQCAQLQSADLAGCVKVTDAGVQSLAQCPQLQSVNLQRCDEVTDAGVQGLAQCPQLQSVNLQQCGNVTDAGVQGLAQCPQLQSVNLDGCDKVTDAGGAALRQAGVDVKA